jgi:hypothetical protein
MATKAEKLLFLETTFIEEKRQLESYFSSALLMDDTDTQTELKAEMADLAEWYAEEKKAIID